MNALVIAQHHGAFLTLQSLIGKVDEVVVVIPQSQLNKYAGFPEKVFQDYGKNMQAYCKKHGFKCWIAAALESPRAILESLEKRGKWVVLAAGALYQGIDEGKLTGYAGAYVKGRLFDRDNRLSMYGMIGLPPVDESVHKANLFVNMDMHARERELAPMAIGRVDPLIGSALSALECLRIRTASSKSAVLHYWMAAINRTHTEVEYLSYPFDEYAKYAKPVKKFLPATAFEVIVENGAQSARYREIAELDL